MKASCAHQTAPASANSDQIYPEQQVTVSHRYCERHTPGNQTNFNHISVTRPQSILLGRYCYHKRREVSDNELCHSLTPIPLFAGISLPLTSHPDNHATHLLWAAMRKNIPRIESSHNPSQQKPPQSPHHQGDEAIRALHQRIMHRLPHQAE